MYKIIKEFPDTHIIYFKEIQLEFNRYLFIIEPNINFSIPSYFDTNEDYIKAENTNMIANILGLGWAATPMGLMAMKELKKLNRDSEVASCDMCVHEVYVVRSVSSGHGIAIYLFPIHLKKGGLL